MINLTNIRQIYRENKTSKAGKPYESLRFKANEYGDNFLSGFGNSQNKSWKEGDSVQVENVTTKLSNGKTYYNFEMPKNKPAPAQVETMALSHKIDQVSSQLLRIINHLSGQNRLDQTSDGKPLPNFDVRKPVEDDGFDQINPEEIPF